MYLHARSPPPTLPSNSPLRPHCHTPPTNRPLRPRRCVQRQQFAVYRGDVLVLATATNMLNIPYKVSLGALD